MIHLADILLRSACYVLMIIVGYLLKRSRMLPQGALQTLTKIVMTVTLPCAVISNFSNMEFDTSLLFLTLLGLGFNGIQLIIGFIAGRKKSGSDKAFEIIHHSGYNLGCFATPFVQNFLGDPGALVTYTFDAGNAFICTGTTFSVAAAAMGTGEKFSLKTFLSRMFSSMPLCTYLIMFLIRIFDFNLPHPIVTFASMTGQANAFLSMLMIGVGFEINLDRKEFGTIFRILLTRYALAAVLATLIYFFMPFDLYIRQALVLIVFAPIPAISLVFTQKTDGNVAMSGTLSSLMIVSSVLFMTLLMILMG